MSEKDDPQPRARFTRPKPGRSHCAAAMPYNPPLNRSETLHGFLTARRLARPVPPRCAARLPALLLCACFAAAPAGADDRENCLLCHRYPGLSRLDPNSGRVQLFYADPHYLSGRHGAHARLACTDCHSGEAFHVVPHGTAAPVDCTRTCHLQGGGNIERRFSHASIAETLESSVHRREVLENLNFSGGPLLAPGQSACLYCHDEPVFRTDRRVDQFRGLVDGRGTDRCSECHTAQLPVDTDYFLRHVGARLSTSRATLEMAQVCAVCHSDPRVLADHDLPNAVASYVRSFHGKAALLGDASTANCISCHVGAGRNAHSMLGADDPRSAVHPQNVADSCRSVDCHPGASKSLSVAAVHIDLPVARDTLEFLIACAFVVMTSLVFIPSALIVLLELVHVVVRRRHPHDGTHALVQRVLAHPDGRRRLSRFPPAQRVQHWILAVLFLLLVLTGFPMKFAEAGWAAALIRMFGGLDTARLVHHWAGIALVIGFVTHLAGVFGLMLRRARERQPDGSRRGIWAAYLSLPAAPGPADLAKGRDLFAYLLGLRRERPTFGRFTFPEKLEYFGVAWGTMVLGVTGLVLWGEQFASHLFGGRIFNFAIIFHTYEAFLAIIHVGILHMYSVIFAPAVFPFSPATVSGATPPDKLAEEHGELVRQAAADLGISAEGGAHA